MYWYEQIQMPVFYNGKSYPQDVFWAAYQSAAHDKNLEAEVIELEEKYIQFHLDRLMAEREREDEEMRKWGLIE